MAKRKKSLQSISGEKSLSGSGKAETAQIHLPDITPSNYGNRASEFGSPCRFCGERFGRYSLPLHLKKCQHRDHVLITHAGKRHSEQHKHVRPCEGAVCGRLREQSMLPLRTRTRSLERSILVEKGYTLPTIEYSSSSTSPRLSKMCGEAISGEDALLCQNNGRPALSRTIAKGNITFPLSGHTHSQRSPPHSKKTFVGRPPTVVCYICGREYGSRSISIHKPQCLRKFELENKKLPIKERKPLPQKPINHAAIVVTSQEHTMPHSTIGSRGIYGQEVLQDAADQYFQYCYSEWEKDLITCKTCGRTFAPERHAKHAHKCKAKPLPDGIRHQ